MLSVVIPTRNAAHYLPHCLSALVPGAAEGLVKEVIVVDGGSRDDTRAVAEAAGALVIEAGQGRGPQLAAGGQTARGEWILFLHADTVLQPGWITEVSAFFDRQKEQGGDTAAVFRFALDDACAAARRMETLVAWRSRILGLPYGDQGLLITRDFYHRLGGFKPIALMEDVDIIRRIGRRRLFLLRTPAVTSADRYRREGYWLRPLRNIALVTLFFLRVPPRILARLYE